MSRASSIIAISIAVTFLVTPPSIAAENTAEYLVMGQVRAAREMVKFCTAALPELSDQLDAAYSALHARSVTVLAPLIQRVQDKQLFNAPVPITLIKFEEDMIRAMLAAVNDPDARDTCRYTLEAMKNRTPEQIQIRGKQVLQNYEQAQSKLSKGAK